MATLIGNGVTISYGGTTIANAQSITIEMTAVDIPIVTLGSNYTEHKSGTKDATFSVEANYDPDNAVHNAIDTAITADALQTGTDVVITFSDATPTTLSFSGLITSVSRSIAVNGEVTMSISGVVNGAITKA